MRIAFFGGSFDPPHLAHLAVAEAAQQALRLDKVLFAPVGLQPLKPAGSSASYEDRVAMTQLAIANHPSFELSRIDAPQPTNPHPNYTVDTLKLLHRQHPSAEWFLLLGADAFRTLHHWRQAEEIPFLANLIVASRPNEDLTEVPRLLPSGIKATQQPNQPHNYTLTNLANRQSNLTVLPNLNYEISATQLRHQIHGHPSPNAIPTPQTLNPKVLNYIHQNHLYE
jgi:nicotinate-nucleotide adenylyltransferase